MCCISVIVPVYNSERTLHRCVDSILSQTFSDFELILVDDGSSDSSGCICDNYARKDKRVRVFHKMNGGVSSARNLGLDNAIGKWVTFCDSDDYVEDDWLGIFMRCCSHDKCLIMQSVNFVGNVPVKNNSDVDNCNVCEFVETFYDSAILGYVFNKLFLLPKIRQNYIRFDEKLKYREDEVFVLHYCLYCNSGIVYTANSGYFYQALDYYTKYSNAEIFEPLFSIFLIINKLYCGSANIQNCWNFYSLQLFHSLFDSFLKREQNCENKLLRFQDLLEKYPAILTLLPSWGRIVLSCRLCIAFIMMKTIATIRRLIKYYK